MNNISIKNFAFISVDYQGLLRPPRGHLLPAGGQVAPQGRGHQEEAALHHSGAAQADARGGGVPESEAEDNQRERAGAAGQR